MVNLLCSVGVVLESPPAIRIIDRESMFDSKNESPPPRRFPLRAVVSMRTVSLESAQGEPIFSRISLTLRAKRILWNRRKNHRAEKGTEFLKGCFCASGPCKEDTEIDTKTNRA